jgi:hypothetical protein
MAKYAAGWQFEAYSRAWKVAGETGDFCERVLFTAFDALKGSDSLDSETLESLLEAWKQRTPPSKLTRLALGQVTESLGDAFKEIADIVRSGYPEWMELPPGVRKVSKGSFGSDALDTRKINLEFTASGPATQTFERCAALDLETSGKGFFKVPVWLDETLLASVKPPNLLGKRRVPDGFLKVKPIASGEFEFGRLRVAFAR